MDSNKIETFLTVCKETSFTKAAEKLFITPAAVKKQIDSLEDELNAQLLYRKSSGCTLTPAGEVFQAEAKNILKAIQKAYERVQSAQSSQHKEIRIGHSVKLDFNFMNELLSAYTDKHPQNYLHFERMKKSELPAALFNGAIDCFIIINPQKNEFKGIKKVLLASSRMYAVVQKKHPLASKEKITFDDLTAYDVYMSSVLDNSLYEDFESLIGNRLHVLDKTDRNDLMVAMIKNGVILYPCPVSHDISIPFEYPALPVYFYYRENDPVLADVYRQIQDTLRDVNNVIM